VREGVHHRDGGKRQVFCREVCRRVFEPAGCRWVAEAIATGALTVDALRNGAATTRALFPRSISPAPLPDGASDRRCCEPSWRSDEAADLLDDFLIASLDLPGDAWPDLAAALPDQIYDRIDRCLEGRLSEDRA
jgi:hypothetical protein